MILHPLHSDCFRNAHMIQFLPMRCQGSHCGSLGRGFLDAKEDKGEEGPYVCSLLIPLQRVSGTTVTSLPVVKAKPAHGRAQKQRLDFLL